MNKIIVNNKDAAGQNTEIRKALVTAMADVGWKLRDDGTPVDIDLSVLESRGLVNAETPSWFINGEEVWRWEVFNAARLELEREGDGKRMHCVDLAVELLGEEALVEMIPSVLGLNEFGFRSEDIIVKGRVNEGLLANKMREYAGPWVAYKTTGVLGEGIRMLYRYDDDRGIYHYIGQQDIICLCRRVDPRVTVGDSFGINTTLVTDPETPVKTEICTDKVVVRGKRLLDIRTMTTTECDESVFVTSCLNARWDESQADVDRTYATEGGKMALKLLSGIEDPQDRKVFLQYLAYTLTPGFHLKKFLIVYGNSNCGKSTTISAWTEGVCPSETCTTFNPSDAFGSGDGKRFGMEGLIGKRIAYCDEWGAYRLSDEGPLKSVVDGRPVNIDLKGQARRTFTPTCKLIAGTNIIPSLQDNAGAINNRIIILDFSRDPFDPATSPNFRPWYKDEDFCTVLLREAVMALNDSVDKCWKCEAGEWYVDHLAQPSEKSRELLKKIRDESARCLEVIAAMLTNEDSRVEVPNMLGMQWSDVINDYKDLYEYTHGPKPKETSLDYLNSVLITTTIGGKHYQFDKYGSFRLPGGAVRSKRGLFYEYSRNRNENGANKRKAGLWNIYKNDCNGSESAFHKLLDDEGIGEHFEECLADVREIEVETARLKAERNIEIVVG